MCIHHLYVIIVCRNLCKDKKGCEIVSSSNGFCWLEESCFWFQENKRVFWGVLNSILYKKMFLLCSSTLLWNRQHIYVILWLYPENRERWNNRHWRVQRILQRCWKRWWKGCCFIIAQTCCIAGNKWITISSL